MSEVRSIIDHLAGMPGLGHATATTQQLRKILLQTGGDLILRGTLYRITSEHLGAGVHRVSTKKASR